MSMWLNTRGENKLAIAICDRCHTKRPWTRLVADGNSPGLKVCMESARKCRDPLDPYKLPPRQTEDISLVFARPDVPLSTGTDSGIPVGDADFDF